MLDVQLTRDFALFIASQPTAEQILAFTQFENLAWSCYACNQYKGPTSAEHIFFTAGSRLRHGVDAARQRAGGVGRDDSAGDNDLPSLHISIGASVNTKVICL